MDLFEFDFDRATRDALRAYNRERQRVASMGNIIRLKKRELDSIRSSSSDSTPVHGGGNRTEENWANKLDSIRAYEQAAELTRERIRIVEQALSVLDERERRVVQLTLISPSPGAVDRLRDELHVERAQVYRIQSQAIQKLRRQLYP